MPLAQLTTRVSLLLENRNGHALTQQFTGTLHSGDTAADNYNVFHTIF